MLSEKFHSIRIALRCFLCRHAPTIEIQNTLPRLDPWILFPTRVSSHPKCTAPSVCRSSWSKWRTNFDTILDTDDERDHPEKNWISWNCFPLPFRSKNGPCRETHWFLRMIDRICFQHAGTWGISCAFPFPKVFEQIDAGDIGTDIWDLPFHRPTDFSRWISVPKMFWNYPLLMELKIRFHELPKWVRFLFQWLAQISSLLEFCNESSIEDHLWRMCILCTEYQFLRVRLPNLVFWRRNLLVELSSTRPEHKAWRSDCARAYHRMFSHFRWTRFREPLSV